MKPYYKPIAWVSGTVLGLAAVALSGVLGASGLKPAKLQLQSAERGVSFRLELDCGSGGVAYVVQTSTNLTDWQTLVAAKAKPGETLPLGTVGATETAKFFRLLEYTSLADTEAPVWTNGVGGRLSGMGAAGVTARWRAAKDNIGVAGYRVYLNGQLVTNVLGSVLEYQLKVGARQPADIRVQAVDVADNTTEILSLGFVPGSQLLAISDDSGRLFVFTAKEDGSFSEARQIANWPSHERGLGVGDFDRDGILDVVAGYASGNSMRMFFLKGKADGSYADPVALPSAEGSNGYAMGGAVGDYDSDGNLDFAINGNSQFTIFYWGQGDGTFTTETKDLGAYGRAMVAGDFNEDGRMDLARVTHSDGNVRLWLSNGDRTFAAPTVLADVGDDPYGMTTGDFDEDGHLDLIANSGGAGDISQLKGYGDGTFTNLGVNVVSPQLDINDHGAMATVDFNGDGHLDLALSSYNNHTLFYWTGNGDGTFTTNRVSVFSAMSASLGANAAPLPPRVDVNFNPRDLVTNLNSDVTFTAEGTGLGGSEVFRWTFGDETSNPLAWSFTPDMSDMGPTVTHKFEKEGRFVTRLWHTDAQSIQSTRGTWVTVTGEPPVANPGGPYELGETAASQTKWTATVDGSGSTDDFGIAQYIWSFGDGTSATNAAPAATAAHTWAGVGPWTVTLNVIDTAGQANAKDTTVTFTPGEPPVAHITGPDVVDETAAVNGVWTAAFSGATSTDDVSLWKYDWTFGNGKTGTGPNPNTTYAAVGNYVVTLTVTDHAGQTHSTTHNVSIVANARPTAVITGPKLLTEAVCTNGLWFGKWDAKASTDDRGTYRWEWNFGDGTTGTGSEITHQFRGAGVYPMVLTVYDFGNQTATTTRNVVVVAGDLPVARITTDTLTPEGAAPIQFSASTSTDDYGIYSYRWLMPLRRFEFPGQTIDADQWRVANATQDGKLIVTGRNSWDQSYFFSGSTFLRRGGALECRIDTPSDAAYAMVGLRNLDTASGHYNRLIYGLYFSNGDVRPYEFGNDRGLVTNYTLGTAYDVRIETKPSAGARYFLRASGTGDPFVQIYESNAYDDAAMGFGATVSGGVFGFDDVVVEGVFYTTRDLAAPVYPGGTVTLEVVDHALQTNRATVQVTPVVGQPPVAVIAGPASGLAGVELSYSAYLSSDDHGIATYTWDFGDGKALAFGPAVAHRFDAVGAYTVTLTVMDYAGQTNSVTLATQIAVGNALAAIPWRIISGIELPHETYSGKEITLKAVARGIPLPAVAIWDFGDGSEPVTNALDSVAAAYAIQARHAYQGVEGTPFYATIRVVLTNDTILSDTYPLVIRPKNLDTESNVAIDEGLWYLHKGQTRRDLEADLKDGYWTDSGYYYCSTASAVQAFGINGHQMTDDVALDPYVETVRRGINFLLNGLTWVNIGPQSGGDPDGNHNGIALYANSGRPIYETGPVMDAFVAAARPELVAPTGGMNVRGRLFRDILQDLVDVYAWGQYDDPNYGGGWRYGWNEFPDNSAAQWGAIGLLAAERFWGIPAPQWVKDRNLIWVAYSKGGTGFGYTGPADGEATTPSGMVQLAADDVVSTNALWLHGERYIANNWSYLMGRNNLYANYAAAKALRTAHPQPISKLTGTGKDWFRDPADGLARTTINNQRADGSWRDSVWVQEQTSTAWSVIILSSSLFQRGPVGVIQVRPNPSAVGFPVIFDARGSYHQHPAYKIIGYRWDFDAADGVDFETPDAVGPLVTNAFAQLSTNLVTLQVRDNNTPPIVATASVETRTTIPPYPPTADAGGPYTAAVGETVQLDGSGSFDVDKASGDYLTAWDWEIDFQQPLDYDDGVAGEKAAIEGGFPTAGPHRVGLRVSDATAIVFPELELANLTTEDFATVYVYDRLVDNLVGRPKNDKCQLTWTKAGDYVVVLRSQLGPNRGFAEIGRTDSGYATFLDTSIELNTEYFYRVLIYRNGAPEPIGVSDVEYVRSLPRDLENLPPYFDTTPVRLAKVGELYDPTLTAKDPENDPVVFNLLSGPTNLTINAASGVIHFLPTPEQLGSHTLEFEVTNAVGRDVLSYSLFVFPAENNPPVANANGPYAALTGQPVDFTSTGSSDPDGHPLAYTWNFGDGRSSTEANPTHTYGAAGDYLVSLFVNDGYGATANATAHAVITRPNRAPVAALVGGTNVTLRLGEAAPLDASTSYDLDGDPLTFTWTWGDDTTDTGPASTASHTYAATGVYAGQVQVADGRGGVDTLAFQVTVQAANQAPTIDAAASTTTPFVMSDVIFDARGTADPDGDALTYAWDFGDRFKTTGPLVSHVYREIGPFTVSLTVSDNRGGLSEFTFDIDALNAPPLFTSNPPLLVKATKPYAYTPTVTDPNDPTVTFALATGPATMACDPATGALAWTPAGADAGDHPVVLVATDPHGTATEQAFTLVVTSPTGPQLDLEPTDLVTTNVTTDSQTFALAGTAKVIFVNNGEDEVPVPYTVSLFVDVDHNGAFAAATDRVVSRFNAPAGLKPGFQAQLEMTLRGTNLFKDAPLSVFVDSEQALPEFNENNNIRRAGFNKDTNQPPVVDLTASGLRVDRSGLPATAGLTARLGNAGLVAVPANVPVAFYDGDPQDSGTLIGLARSTSALVPGQFEDLTVAWATPTIAKYDVVVIADDAGDGSSLYAEISETNNRLQAEADLTANEPPVADAGPDQTFQLGDTAVLNGRASTDPEGKPLTYRWTLVSIPIGSQATLQGADTVQPSFLPDLAGAYTVQLIVNDGTQDSATPDAITLTLIDAAANHAPSITSTPSFQGMVGVLYEYPVQATDPDNDPLTFKLAQAPTGMTIDAAGRVTWTPASAGPALVQIEVTDGRGAGFYQNFTLTVAPYENLAPQFASKPGLTAAPEAAYQYDAEATDNNRDSVTYALTQAPAGMTVNAQSGLVAWTPPATAFGGYPVTLTASDGKGGVATQTFNLVVLNAGAAGPTVHAIPDQLVTDPAAFTSIALDLYVTDPDNTDAEINWTVTGTNALTVTIDGERLATVSYPAGTVAAERVTFVATDPNGNSAYAAPLFEVRALDHPPVAALANLSATDTTSITTGFFELKGTVDDPDATDPVAYRVLLYNTQGERVADVTPKPVTSAGWHEGRVPAGASLGTLDLTLLRNEAYTLLLEVRGGYQTASAYADIAIDSQLKVGAFSFTQQDLVLPVRGLGLRVERAYDSLNLKSSDFGYGWTYTVADLGLAINEQRLRTSDLFGQPFSLRVGGSWDVTLDMPDTGRRVTFRFQLLPGRLFKSEAVWEAPPGVNARLAPTCSPYLITLTQALPPYWEASGIDTDWQNFDWPGFTLTTQDGTQYRVDRRDEGEHYIDGSGTAYGTFVHAYSGAFLSRITERTGDRTEFVRENALLRNIEQYDLADQKLKSILFQRDNQDRIAAIYTPENVGADGTPIGPAAITYAYDDAGNLTSASKLTDVTDPANPVYATTTYEYSHPRFPHYITRVQDPRGLDAMRTEYDATGRVVGMVDVFGNRTVLGHDVDARTETIYDRQGHATHYAYDEHGNVLAKTDPLGRTTRYTYDPENHQTSVTDPLGHIRTFAYDAAGRRISETNPLGHTTLFIYDPQGNLLSQIDPLGRATTNLYDPAGRLLATIDAAGQRRDNEYDTAGLVVAHRNTLGQVTARLYYDALGNLSGISNSIGAQWSYQHDDSNRQVATSYPWVNPADSNDVRQVTTRIEYDPAGQMTKLVNGDGNERKLTLDATGQVTVDRDEQGGETRHVYDAAGNLIQTLFPDGTTVLAVYDENSRVILRTDRNPQGQPSTAVHVLYDAAGRIVQSQSLRDVAVGLVPQANGTVRSVVTASGSVLTTTDQEYDAAGRLTRTKDAMGRTTRREYDDAGRLTALINDLGDRQEFAYDAAGRQLLSRDALGQETQFLYDAVGRLTRTVFPDGTTSSVQFDVLGRRVAETDPNGTVRRFEYDSEGQLTAVVLPEVTDAETGNRLSPRYEYTYDARGNWTHLRDPNGQVTQFAYDHRDRQIARTLPAGQSERREYNNQGRLASTADFNGQRQEILYDPIGREIGRNYYAPGATAATEQVTFSLGDPGRLTAASDQQGLTRYAYDLNGQLAQIQSPEGTLHYEYDAAGRRIGTRTDHTETRYAYDALGRLNTVTAVKRNGETLSQPETTTYEYNAAGHRAALQLPNGIRTTYQYDSLGRLTALTQRNREGGLLASYAYALAPDGRRLRATQVRALGDTGTLATNETRYVYDALSRLTQDTHEKGGTTAYVASYEYDLAGNRWRRTIAAGGNVLQTSYRYDANHRLLVESNSVAGSTGALALQMDRGALLQQQRKTTSTLNLMAVLVLFSPLLPFFRRWADKRRRQLAELGPDLFLPTLRRGRSLTLLARATASAMVAVMALSPAYQELLAVEAAQNLALTTGLWAKGDTVISYTYDANGAVIQKNTTGAQTATETFAYDLQSRLTSATIQRTDAGRTLTTATTYAHNYQGARVKTAVNTTVDGTVTGGSTNVYLIDPANPSGYAQVLEELPSAGAKPTRSYTLGDDLIAQASGAADATAEYFLHDGHGSTRHLSDALGQLVDLYDYDAFGVMLGGTPTAGQPGRTSMLYAGEAFDAALGQYYLRARYYDPLNGRFNRMDPSNGNQADPASLHKYAYAANDPVNGIDPSGQVTLLEVTLSVVLIMLIVKLFILPAPKGKNAHGIRMDATIATVRSRFPGCGAWDTPGGDNAEVALLLKHFAKWYRDNESKMQHVDGPIRPFDMTLVGSCGWHAQNFEAYLQAQKKDDPSILKVYGTSTRGMGKCEMTGGGYQEAHTFLMAWPKSEMDILDTVPGGIEDLGINFDSWMYHDEAPNHWGAHKLSWNVNDPLLTGH